MFVENSLADFFKVELEFFGENMFDEGLDSSRVAGPDGGHRVVGCASFGSGFGTGFCRGRVLRDGGLNAFDG